MSGEDLDSLHATQGVVEEDIGLRYEDDKSRDLREVTPRLSLKLFRYGTTFDHVIVITACILNVGTGVLMPIFMTLFGDMINEISGGPSKGPNYYVFWLLKLGAISLVLSALGATLVEFAAERQMKALKQHFLSSIMRQEMAWFDRYDPGKLSSTLSECTSFIRDGLGVKLAQLCTCVGLFIGGYAVSFSRGWRLTLVLLSMLPVLASGGWFMMRTMATSASGATDGSAQSGSVAEEAFSTIRTIVAFGLEERMIHKYRIHADEAYKIGVRGSIKIGLGLGYTLAAFALSFALGFWYSGRLVSQDLDEFGILCALEETGCFTGGKALGVFFCVIMAAFALGQASPSVGALGQAAASMEIIHNIITRPSAIDPDSPSGFIPTAPLKGYIEFRNVTFTYPTRTDRQVFRNLNLKLESGKSTALVGASGCGKSTIIQLIERFYDVDKGELLIDGRNIQDYNVKWLRQQMALVGQEPRLFATSIKENIAYGRDDASIQDIEAAAKAANAHEFIMTFPDGYDTYVGEAGGQLSGGQKQRIAIARAILRNPSILILDEATSALDNESEKIVQETLDNVLNEGSRTTLIIAHRLTTVRKADRIVVLDNKGKGAVVVEEGTHEELMSLSNGLYAALVASQSMPDGEDNEESMVAVAAILDELSDYEPKHAGSVLKLRSKFSKSLSRISRGSLNLSRMRSQDFDKFSSVKSTRKPSYFRRTFRLSLTCRYRFVIGLVGSLCAGLYWSSTSIIMSKYVGSVYSPNPEIVRNDSRKWALTFVGVAAGIFLVNFLQKSILGSAGQQVVRKLRVLLFEALMYQDIAYFDDPSHTTGNLTSMLSSDVVALKGWVSDNIGFYFETASSFISALVISFVASPKLAAVTLAGFAIMAPALIIQNAFMVSSGSDEIPDASESSAQLPMQSTSHILNEVLLNLKTVMAYSMENRINAKYQICVDAYYRRGRIRALYAGIAWGIAQAIPYYVIALCLWYGSKLVEEGQLDTENMMRAMMALILSAMGLGQSAMFTTDNLKAQKAAERVFRLLDREVPIDARNEGGFNIPSVIKEGVEYRHVNFRYPQRPDSQVYRDVSFTIRPGEIVALVGASGCGKSTAVQLLERFYDAKGSITIDNMSIKDLKLRELRACIGLVSQEPALFDESIEDNIGMGKVGEVATPEEIREAAKLANAYTFIEAFPDGFQTSVGKLGGQLSGGQKQRIAIARALIRDPQILILDEATSALDAESERLVQAALDQVLRSQKRTTIVIAHRLSTIQNADKIVVLVNQDCAGSRVAEVGTHQQLMGITNGVYRGLVKIAQGK